MKRTIAVLSLVATASAAQAGFLVDTGTPNNDPPFYLALGQGQELGVNFATSFESEITEIQSYMSVEFGGGLTLDLHDGATPNDPVIFSKTFVVPPGEKDPRYGLAKPEWQIFDGLDWHIDPGAYTLTFEPVVSSVWFGGIAVNPPHRYLPQWTRNVSGLNGPAEWTSLPNALAFRVVVPGISEPPSLALLAGGLLLLAGSSRFRREQPRTILTAMLSPSWRARRSEVCAGQPAKQSTG